MRVLHVPYSFYPDPAGGAEVYVLSLAQWQRRRSIDALVAAPGQDDASYTHATLPVLRFRTSGELSLRSLYGEGDPEAAASFAALLGRTSPDVVHLHAFTPAIGLRLVKAARQREIPVVFTYHTPAVSCVRGTLLLMGQEICDGDLRTRRCARCNLQGMGLSPWLAAAVTSLPESVGGALERLGASGGPWTALRMTQLIGSQHAAFHRLMSEVDHVVAVCEWVRETLVRNGVDSGKITLSRQGLPYPPDRLSIPAKRHEDPLRIAFLGRLSPVKGLDTLVEAVLSRPALRVRLDIFGVAQDEAGRRMAQSLSRLCSRDGRICFQDPIDAAEVASRLTEYDALAVPSRWLETGPLVVYEAFAAGIPVVGSNLGGIAELVRDGENGLLVPSGSVQAWAQALESLVETPGLLERLKSGVAQPRTMEDAARDMDAVYMETMHKVAARARVCN